ncbi:MAG: glycosyltransferase family 2 protein [bacterium]
MLVSIIVCAHRTDRFKDLKEAIESLKQQSYPYCEIILVIDGNSELFALVQEHIEEVRVILNEENLGLSESRNRALSMAFRESSGLF